MELGRRENWLSTGAVQATLSEAMPMIPPGTLVGRDFVVERALGEGGMGTVFVALQKTTGLRRAVKLMRPEIVRDPRLRERFVLEARLGGSIPSDHIVQVITAGIDDATAMPFLVMELLEGVDLAIAVRQNGCVDPETLGLIFEQLCHAVGAAHRAGIVHRDLKPENIFLAKSRTVGSNLIVKVLDFGIAKVVGTVSLRPTGDHQVEVIFSDVVMEGGGETQQWASGKIVGEVDKVCLIEETSENGSGDIIDRVTGKPALQRRRDEDWSSPFCAMYK